MNTDLYAAIGEHVRRAREAQGMTQADLAQRVGFRRTSIVNLEKGRQRVPLDTLANIAAILDVATGDLLPPSLWPSRSATDAAARICALETQLADIKTMLREVLEEIDAAPL